MSDFGYAYGAAAAYADAPFDNLSLPASIDLVHDQFDHDDENAVDLEYLGYEYDPDHVDADADVDLDVDVDVDVDVDIDADAEVDHSNHGLQDIDIDIDIYDQDIDIDPGSDPESADHTSQPLTSSSSPFTWDDGLSDLDHSGSEGGVVIGEQGDHERVQEDAVQQQQHHQHFPPHFEVPDSDDEDDDEDDSDQVSQPDVENLDNFPYYYHNFDDDDNNNNDDDDNEDDASLGHDQAGEGSSREPSVVSIGDDQSVSSRTASLPPNGADDRSTLSPSSPVSLLYDQSENNSRSASGSDLITISDDSDRDTASVPGTASQSSAGSVPGAASVSGSVSASLSSQGSRPGPRAPHCRQPRRLSGHSDPDINFNINPRASPRLSSLTPVFHPNRRLPRQASEIRQSPQNLRSATDDPSDFSSADELIAPQPQRRLGIERTRRPVFANAQRLSSRENHNSSSSSTSTSSSSSNSSSSLSPSGEDAHDDLSQSDLEEDLGTNNSSQTGGSQESGPVGGRHYPDGVFEDEEGDLVLQDRHQGASEGEEVLHVWEVSADEDEEEEEEPSLLARQQQRRRDRFFRQLRQHQEEGAAARERRRRAARNPFLDSDLEQSDADMDGDDELVEVVFDRQLDGPPAPPLQRQPRHQQRQRINRHNNRGQAVELIDLTEEPDSPVQNHAFQNHNQNQNQPHLQQYNRSQQRPRHHRRMPQIGHPPSLARSDGSLLGGQHGPAVIDLTNDEPELGAAGDNDDDDGLFVGQDFDDVLEHIPANGFDDLLRHIPPNRRLPEPVPGPPHRDRRRSVELIGFAARHLRNVGGQYLPGLLAALPGMPRGFANEIAIIGRDQGLAMNPNPLADNPPDFNYQANGFGARPPPPKPEFDAPPPARPGFTRNTGVDPETGEELEIVCASCDNELKYDDDDDDGPRPAKRPRNKKDREEHHFWAVKACGHVYCKSCYDNRKKTKGKDYAELDMHFRVEQSSTAKSAKIFCAVDNCDSDVTQNNSWVGIFM